MKQTKKNSTTCAASRTVFSILEKRTATLEMPCARPRSTPLPQPSAQKKHKTKK